MKRIVVWLVVVAALVIGLVLHRSKSANNLNVTPDAERVIEKAKRR